MARPFGLCYIGRNVAGAAWPAGSSLYEVALAMNIEIGNRLVLRFSRVLALVCLIVGLLDAGRLLGVHTGSRNPVEILGGIGFVYLTVFALARLFCAVGLWLNSSWGAVVLVGAAVIELALVLFGNPNVSVSGGGILVRIFLLIGGVGVLAFVQIKAIDLVNR